MGHNTTSDILDESIAKHIGTDFELPDAIKDHISIDTCRMPEICLTDRVLTIENDEARPTRYTCKTGQPVEYAITVVKGRNGTMNRILSSS